MVNLALNTQVILMKLQNTTFMEAAYRGVTTLSGDSNTSCDRAATGYDMTGGMHEAV